MEVVPSLHGQSFGREAIKNSFKKVKHHDELHDLRKQMKLEWEKFIVGKVARKREADSGRGDGTKGDSADLCVMGMGNKICRT